MSEPTQEEMQDFLKGWYQNCKETTPDCASQCSEKIFLRCELTYKTIYRLIERYGNFGKPGHDVSKFYPE